MNGDAMRPRFAPFSLIASLNASASSIRDVLMIASPEMPRASLTTGPTSMATRSWIRMASAYVLLCLRSAGGNPLRRHSTTCWVGTSGRTTMSTPSPRSSMEHESQMLSMAFVVILRLACLISRRWSLLRICWLKPTTSVLTIVQFWPFSSVRLARCPSRLRS